MKKCTLIASVSRQVSLSSKPHIMRVANVRDLDTTAISCFEGRRCAWAPIFYILLPGLDPYPALSRSMRNPTRPHPLSPWAELRPHPSSTAGILKAGAAGIECSLKAKNVMVPVMIGATAAQTRNIQLIDRAFVESLVNLALL